MLTILALISVCATPAPTRFEPATYNVMFLGNSHTAANDLSGMVKQLLLSDPAVKSVAHETYFAGFLNDFISNQDVVNKIKSGKFNYIVMQGLKLSSSHNFEYDNSPSIRLAKLARKAGSTVVFFAEWPRRDWDESQWQYEHYRAVSDQTGATVAPIPFAWDLAVSLNPGVEMWAGDGNHAMPGGSYLAACTIAMWIRPSATRIFNWVPTETVPAGPAAILRRAAADTVEKYLGAQLKTPATP